MERFTTRDGTQLAYYRAGHGPPLVLVHGTAAANARAWTAAPLLEQHFSVYALTRRGRAESGDSGSYAVQREYEDIAALVDHLGQPAAVLGHSFGALLALEAALLTSSIRRLMLYEPSFPLPGQPPIYPAGSLDRLQALIDSGDNEAALVHFYLEVVEMQPAMLDQLRDSPAWPERVMGAPTLLREAQAEESYIFDPRRFARLATPTLFLLGSESPESFRASSRLLSAVLPNSQTRVLEGQQHLAMYTDPRLFVQVIQEFCI